MLKLFIIAIIPAAITFWLPRKWLLIWLPLFWGSLIYLWNSIDFTDDPAFISASLFFGPFWLINVPATIARLAFLLADVNAKASRGYSDPD